MPAKAERPCRGTIRGHEGDDDLLQKESAFRLSQPRVRKEHPLRAVRTMTDEILDSMSPLFDVMYAKCGRPSITPEELLRAH